LFTLPEIKLRKSSNAVELPIPPGCQHGSNKTITFSKQFIPMLTQSLTSLLVNTFGFQAALFDVRQRHITVTTIKYNIN
jgi:hypothetical protein